MKKLERSLIVLLESELNVDTNRINYGLIKEENFIITFSFDDNDALIYSTYNEGKLVVAERFIRTLKG